MTDGRTDGRTGGLTDKAATICSPFGEHKKMSFESAHRQQTTMDNGYRFRSQRIKYVQAYMMNISIKS